MDDQHPLCFAFPGYRFNKSRVIITRWIVEKMQGVYPYRPLCHGEMKHFITIGNRVVLTMFKAENIWAIQTISPIASDNRTGCKGKRTDDEG